MKLSIVKILYYWSGRVNPDFKYKSFQISWFPNFRRSLGISISCQRYFGNVIPIDLDLLGLISLNVSHTTKEDHAGLRISLNLLGLDFEWQHIDARHYDYDNDRWEECDIEDFNRNYKDKTKK